MPDSTDESGLALIEVVISALVVVIIAIGAFGALEAAGRAGAEERHREQAYAIAQADQARLRSLPITQLLNMSQSRGVTQDGDAYTVVSTSRFTTDSTGTLSCDSGVASADYLSVTSTVTWPSIGTRPPVVIESIIAPPNGSFAEDRGALAVAVRDSQSNGIPGISLTGSGAGVFSGPTGSNGCAIFANLPEGNYTLTPTASGYVDKDGVPAGPVATSVVAQSTNSVALQLDRPGTINATFRTKVGTGYVNSSSDTMMVFNTGMTAAKRFGTVGVRGAPGTTLTATSLFPFASTDAVYAGACTGNNPGTGLAIANVTVPVNGSVTTSPQIALPALNLTVRSGTGSSSPGSLVSGARVTVTDDNCSISGTPVKRVFTTNASGKLADPGLPWSQYDVCVSNATKRVQTNDRVVKNPATPTNLTVYLGSTGALTGVCP